MNIIITGASSGVGYQAVLQLLKEVGHKVIAIARSADLLNKLLQQTKKGSSASQLYILPFDIVHGDYNQLVPFIKSHFSSVDVLINNAGSLVNKAFADTTIEDLDLMLQTNLVGHFKMIQSVLPLMGNPSHILNIGSMGGYQGSVKFPGLAAYSASKAALHVLTECLAAELSEKNIKVNCLSLGSAQTEMLSKAFPGYQSPVSAESMGQYIADFAMKGHQLFNGKILPVAVTTP